MNQRIHLLVKYLLPAIFTNVCVFLFGIIDGIFVGNGVGTNALGAINIVWPFVMLTYGLNVLTSIGGVTIAAIRFGRGDIEGANKAFLHSLLMTVVIAFCLSILGVIFTEPISRMLGASNTYIDLVRDYLFWYALFTVPASIAVNFEHFCRNDGDPTLVALATLLSTLLNIFLDWLFVFPLQMGIMGAAFASGISQTFALLIVSLHFLRSRGNLRLRHFKVEPAMFKKISMRGTPDMLSQFASPVTIFCMNLVLARSFGDLGINTYAIITYVASFALAILYGVSEGLQPLFGQSYGKRDVRSLKFYFHAGLLIALVGSTICVVATNLLSYNICMLYGTNQITAETTQVCMPEYAWGYIIAGLNALISAYLFSTKRTGASVLFNVLRSFILNATCILLLPVLFTPGIVWYTYGISEFLVFISGILIIRINERRGLCFI